MMLVMTDWARPPRSVRLPPQTFRFTTAGRIPCSARQLVASTRSSAKKVNMAGASRSRWARNFRTSSWSVSAWQRGSSRSASSAAAFTRSSGASSRAASESFRSTLAASGKDLACRGRSSQRWLALLTRCPRPVWCLAFLYFGYTHQPSRPIVPSQSAPTRSQPCSKPLPRATQYKVTTALVASQSQACSPPARFVHDEDGRRVGYLHELLVHGDQVRAGLVHRGLAERPCGGRDAQG